MTILITPLAPCSYRDRATVLWQTVAALLCAGDFGPKVGASGSAISFGRRRQRRASFRLDTHFGNSKVNREVVGMHRGNLVAAAGVMAQSSEEAGESSKAAESLGFAQLKDATGVVQVTKNKELQR